MHKVFGKLLLFVIILIPILWRVNHFIASIEVESYARRKFNELANPEVDAEIVVIGACRALSGINVKELEPLNAKIYNFSLQGVNPVYIKHWYTKMFNKYYKKPKLIIYSVDLDQFTNSRNLSQDSQYFPVKFFLRSLFDFDLSIKILLSNRLPLIKYMPLFQVCRSDVDHWLYEKGFYRGFVPLTKRIQLPGGDGVAVKGTSDEGFKNDPRQVEAFRELIKLFQSEGITVVYVIIPDYYINKNSYLPSKGTAEIVKILKEAENKKDIFFLDYNNDITTRINHNELYYYDVHNLCGEGSDLFTHRLRKDLAQALFCMLGREHEEDLNYEACLNRLSISVICEDVSRTRKLVQRVIELNPKSANCDVGNIYFSLAEYTNALGFYKEAIEMGSKDPQILINVGEIYFRMDQFMTAKDYMEKAIEVKPDHAQTRFYLGTIYARMGKYELAESSFKKAIELNPLNDEYYNNLGYIYYELKDNKNALKYFQRANELNPFNESVKGNIEEVKIVLAGTQ